MKGEKGQRWPELLLMHRLEWPRKKKEKDADMH
jgi:hypothetical protein